MHHIQRHIINNLTRNISRRYKDLKPHGIDPNLFMYHLRQLQKDELVIKLEDGSYSLSPNGKSFADKGQFDQVKGHIYEQPRLMMLLVVHDIKKGWLMHTRKIQPVINMTGFLHANAELGESVTKTAKKLLKDSYGLSGDFSYRGSARLTMYKDDDLESYVHALILVCDNPKGNLISETELGSNEWVKKPNFSLPTMMPSVSEIIQLIDKEDLFFVERSYTI